MGNQFTEKMIAAAKPRSRKYYLREGRGFTLQVMPTGTKTFLYIFELDGSKGYLRLGQYPGCTLAEARRLYNVAYNSVKKGIDPREEKKAATEKQLEAAKQAVEEAKAAASAAEELGRCTFDYLLEGGIPEEFTPQTVEQLAAVWMVRFSQVNHTKRWRDTVLSCLRLHVLPAIGGEEINAIRRRHAVALIEKIAATLPGAARNAMKLCRQMFKYAYRMEWAEIQPFNEITESVPRIAPKADERHLDDDEIVRAWNEIDRSAMSLQVKRAIKLVLVTAQRPGEVTQMHREQIKGRWWTIPAEVAKNRREHRVYLTDTALNLIGDTHGYIFPSDGKSPHISPTVLSKAINRSYENTGTKTVGKEIINASKKPYFGMKPWSPQDLRRTARTNMARVGIIEEVAEEVVNHKKSGIVGIYNKYRYDKEKEVALTKWEQLLIEILKGEPEADGRPLA
ncbi:tyrosine-type recombinase/integrase [Geomonas paludis]|uniref:Integrase n=1 Tax=Geomonas paludis TaxID=2740185 RepID=A0A6V8MT65_9BACT|nr:site-specific integrase [Geomonas paludis]GFO63171.1 integrase [Geomonas paludis]